MNFLEFFGLYFDCLDIFSDLFHLKNNKKGLFNRAGPAELTWHDAHTWRSHARPHGHTLTPTWLKESSGW